MGKDACWMSRNQGPYFTFVLGIARSQNPPAGWSEYGAEGPAK